MNRYNIFNQTHKALRVLLFETASSIQQTDFCNDDESAMAISKLENVIELFEKHADTEDTIVFPAIQQFEPAIINHFNEDHKEDLNLGNRLRGLVTALFHAVSEEDKKSIGISLSIALIEFMVFNLEHMAGEEDIINNILWQHYTDAELFGITARIIASVPTDISRRHSILMMRGLNNAEIIKWLKNVQNNAPDTVFQDLIGLAEQELSPQRWELISEEIAERMHLA